MICAVSFMAELNLRVRPEPGDVVCNDGQAVVDRHIDHFDVDPRLTQT